MKALKITVIASFGFIIALIVTPNFLESELTIEHEQFVEAPLDVIYRYINNIDNYSKWTTWNQDDGDLKTVISARKIGKDASMSWQSEKQGDGKVTIIENKQNQRVKYRIELIEKKRTVFSFDTQIDLIKKEKRNTLVRWSTVYELPFFLRYFAKPISEKLQGQFETSLLQLNAQLK